MMIENINGGKAFGVFEHWHHKKNTLQIDLDFVAHWFDCGVAKEPLIQPVANGFVLRFKVLCFTEGREFYEYRQSEPMPCRSYQEALTLANKLGIIKPVQ